MKLSYNHFNNYGYMVADVPSNLLNELNILIHEKELKKYNIDLAGNIKKEFSLPKAIPIFEDYLLHLSKIYDDKFNYMSSIAVCTNSVPFVLNNMWVNFQKKYEFNPIHKHVGVYSFVIWVKIPYSIEEEEEKSPGKDSNSNLAGCFQFQFSNILGEQSTSTLRVDKTWQGKLCFFPAQLHHCVYPFYSSDEERITVSGNISLNTRP